MNELDAFSERLHELGQRAPVPVVDPVHDIRRGRIALRRRRTRAAAGATTTLVAAGVVLATVPGRGAGADPAPVVTSQPSRSSSPRPVTVAEQLCGEGGAVSGGKALGTVRRRIGEVASTAPWQEPAVARLLADYRSVTAAVLDPAGRHLDRRVSNVQSSCDGDGRLTSLGTKLGWKSGRALGMVQIEVGRGPADDFQIVMGHDRWTADEQSLPAGVVKVRVADDEGGRAVVVKRADGLTVAVDTAGVWGNNAAPGSPAAGDLPGVGKLVRLAADERLTLPEG